MKTILVTGGAGFLGGHLVETLLKRGHRVVCFDLFTYAGSFDQLAIAMAGWPHHRVDRLLRREDVMRAGSRLVLMRGDLNDTATLARLIGWCDGVISLAAETHVDYSYHAPEVFVRANINGPQSLLEALRLAGPAKRLLHVSTDEVYGEVPRGAATEDAPLRPRNVYAATKACGEMLVRTTAAVFGLDVVVVRPCNLYGPRQQPKDLIPKTFARLQAGRKMTIHGDGRHVREYLYVGDGARMLAAIYERGRSGETYNLSSGDFRSTREVVGIIAGLLGRRFADVASYVEDRPNPDRRYAGANGKVKRLLRREWRLTPFATGLAAMLASLRASPPRAVP